MKLRHLYWLVLLLVAGVVLAACQTPAPVVQAPAPEQPTAQMTVPSPTALPTATPEPPPTDTPTLDSNPTQAGDDNPPPADQSTEDDLATEDPPAGEEPSNPLAADPDRPGLTLDGSPSLGAADAPIVIVDFSDFQ